MKNKISQNLNTPIFIQTLELCKMYNIKPQKSKGQNFLVNDDIYNQIIDSADLKPEDTVLEVGPGLGFLTFKLAKKVKKVLTVEIDPKLAQVLDVLIKSQNIKNVKIFNQDILKARGDKFSKIGKYKIVSNLPYNITSIFLRKFLSLSNKPEAIILMLQKEVVNRIIANPPKMSLLSASVQFYAEANLMFEVGRENFYPSPEVDSAVIKIIPNKKYLANYDEEKKFFSLLKIGFSSKRKMLKNNLANSLNLAPEVIEKAIVDSGLNNKIRPEELSIEKWLQFFKRLL